MTIRAWFGAAALVALSTASPVALAAGDLASEQVMVEARHWMARGRDDLAADMLNRLLVTQPNHPQALVALAQIEARAGRHESAQKLLAKAHDADPSAAKSADVRRLQTSAPEAPKTPVSVTPVQQPLSPAGQRAAQAQPASQAAAKPEPQQALARPAKSSPDESPKPLSRAARTALGQSAPNQRSEGATQASAAPRAAPRATVETGAVDRTQAPAAAAKPIASPAPKLAGETAAVKAPPSAQGPAAAPAAAAPAGAVVPRTAAIAAPALAPASEQVGANASAPAKASTESVQSMDEFKTAAATQERWGETRQKLEQLARAQPTDARIQQQLATHLTYREASRREGIRLLEAMSQRGVATSEGRQAWRQALLSLSPRAGDEKLFSSFLARYPDPDVTARSRMLQSSDAKPADTKPLQANESSAAAAGSADSVTGAASKPAGKW